MKRHPRALFYFITIAGLLAIIMLVLQAGRGLESAGRTAVKQGTPASLNTLLGEAMKAPLSVFLLQLAAIIVATRIFGYLFRKIGQPSVVGEIVAGIVLGPSVVGALLPGFSAVVFPQHSLGYLQVFSQIGLILFMFVIGMELDWRTVREKAGAAVVISHASIVIPYGLGIGLSYFLYTSYAPAGIPFYSFALFMGIAMSITAFPVLASIIRERKLGSTALGAMALTCAAADDVTAWCILALVIAVARAGSIGDSWLVLLLAVGYVGVMFWVVRPLLVHLARRSRNATLSQGSLAIVFLVLIGSAWCSEAIGIHALFGAFLAGVIMPADGGFRKAIIEKTEDVALVLLLPLFFAFTGLRTHIGLLSTGEHWGWCILIIAVAVAGKFGGAALAARITGETPRNSIALGALMNTRGLMELVVLNIGLDLNILSPQIFAMMVLMALVTTFMTSPILNLVQRGQ